VYVSCSFAIFTVLFKSECEWLFIVPKKMVDEMTQTSDAYVNTPEKMPKGTRGYKKLFAGKYI
jgi:hypothetical protein